MYLALTIFIVSDVIFFLFAQNFVVNPILLIIILTEAVGLVGPVVMTIIGLLIPIPPVLGTWITLTIG